MRFCLLVISIVALTIGFYPNLLTQISAYLNSFIDNSLFLTQYLNELFVYTSGFVDKFPKLEGWRIFLLTSVLTLFLHKIYLFLFHNRLPLKQRIIENFFYFIRKAPIIKGRIKVEVAKANELIRESAGIKNAPTTRATIPDTGLSSEEVLTECEAHARLDSWDWQTGKVSGTVYVFDKQHRELMQQVYALFYETNPLHPDVFPGVRKMESEIITMCLDLFNGTGGCGITTSGGTASILMAMKAYREVGYSKGIEFPEIILSYSTHSAFMKAASYFGMRPVRLNVGKDYKADTAAYERAITNNTVVLIASAPGYPHGIIDPVQEIAALGVKHKVGVHVDCCLGSFMVPFLDEAGYPIPLIDFRLEGVTSISCDTHKYGNGPKGCSVIMYRSKELRTNQYFADPNFMGGIYSSPGLPGSRNGSLLASTWATMVYTGRQGYVDKTRDIVEVRREVEREIEKIPELFVFGEPKVSVIAIGSNDVDIYAVSDQMAKKGWHVNNNQFPAGIHMAFTSVHIGKEVPKQFIADLKSCLAIVKKGVQKLDGVASMYGVSTKIPDRNLVGELIGSYMDAMLDNC